jgi:hypothetical protein
MMANNKAISASTVRAAIVNADAYKNLQQVILAMMNPS